MVQPVITRPASAECSAEYLLTHLLALVVQTNEQVGQLSLLMDTRSSLEDPPLEPPKRVGAEAVPQEVQRAVLKQMLNDEMRRQLKLLSQTADVLYDCADKVTCLKFVKRRRLPVVRKRP